MYGNTSDEERQNAHGTREDNQTNTSTTETSSATTSQISMEDLIQSTVRAVMIYDQQRNATRENMPTTSAVVVPSTPTFSNREISALLPEFSGTDQGVNLWLERVGAVQNVYNVPDNVMQVIAVSKLTSQAKEWYLSKVEHVTMNWDTLRGEFKRMFGSYKNVIILRKIFERRKWKHNEQFANYFHEKVTLGNNAAVPQNELIQYIIDGFENKVLQSQARMMLHEIKTTEDLFRIMNNVSKEEGQSGASYISKPNVMRNTSGTRGLPGNRSTLRCFNCNQEGHRVTECTKPRRERGSCFKCGRMDHQYKDCPQRNTRQEERSQADSTTNMVQSDHSGILPYIVDVDFSINNGSECCKYSLTALIDSGSPISLIKSKYISSNLYIPNFDLENYTFTGLNGSPLEILGLFQKDVFINNVCTNVKFFVVPDTTMSYACILGRDLFSKPYLKVCLGLGTKVEISESSEVGYNSINEINFIEQIMNIDYVSEPNNVSRDLNVNPNLSYSIIKNIHCIYENDYLSDNSNSDNDHDFEMSIFLKHSQPISYRPRRLSFTEKQKLQLLLDDLMKANIIRPSTSPYAFPIVLVKKKTGDIRLCVDFRELNKITIKDNFPTPLIEDHLDRLKDKKFFTTLDLKNGFHHVKMAESSIKYTSFVTPLGQFEYLKMPFGLCNAPRVFGRFTQNIFQKLLKDNKVLLFMDDVLIATETVSEHLNILQEVFQLAKKYNLKFRLDKCYFLYNEITYLGYLINESGIRPSISNVESVLNYPLPKNIKEVHRFVSLASYFRRFIPNFANQAKSLYDLLKKNVVFKFGKDEFEAFEKLKQYLSSCPILSIYSPDLETELHCDASSHGFGAILLQKQRDGIFKPVSYFSHRTSPTESNYHSFELETLSAIYAIKRFHVYLLGIPFKIVTDCDSFRLTLSKQTINPRISRWAMFLQNYDYTIEHRSSKRMRHVDALSRCHNVLTLEASTLEKTLSIKQDQDPIICNIREGLEKAEDKFFEICNGLVYRKEKNKLLFYVPNSMVNNVIRTCHDDIGHVGVDKVIDNIIKIYWFPNMRKLVKQYISDCLKCIEYSPLSGRREGFLHSLPKGLQPFDTIHIDHYGPLEKTGRSYKYIFEVIDGFTKFIRFYPCISTKTEEVIKHLKDYFRTYSKPNRIISDRGTSFTSGSFAEFLKNESVIHVLIATGTPRANGQIERSNRTLTPMLAKLTLVPSKWDQVLKEVEYAMNNTVCRSTGETPSKLLFGVNQTGKITDPIRLILESINNDENRDLVEMRKKASENITKAQVANEMYYNRRHKCPNKYNVGEYIVIKNHDVTPGVNKKLLPKFKGPLVVKEVLDFDRYVVSDIDGFQLSQVPFKTVVGPDQIKPWLGNSTDFDADP